MTGLLSSIAFATPLALAGLLLLPLIWWLLRFTPPKPDTVKFPPLRLLLELSSREQEPDKTPWWLMLLRMAIAALVILAVAHPSYAPGRTGAMDRTPLLLVVDDGWATAEDWSRRQDALRALVDEARAAGAVVSLATTTPAPRPQELAATDPATAAARVAALAPRALSPDLPGTLKALQGTFAKAAALRVVWLSDGLGPEQAAAFASGLKGLAGGGAPVEVIVPEPDGLPAALAAPAIDGGKIRITALRAPTPAIRDVTAIATATNGRTLAEVPLHFDANSGTAAGGLDLPVELRNDVGRLTLAGSRNAAAVFLLDDRWRRKTIALQSGAASEEAQPLLSPLYYVSRALEPFGVVSEPANANALKDALDAGLSMLITADIGVVPETERKAILDWVARGGVLVRFAGPRLSGAPGDNASDPLIPVTLRGGGRDLGSALSWETPQGLQDFPASSPFAGLPNDPSVRITRQVLAEPDADLPGKVWSSLADGTPLVTARREGKGTIVLFHVTANADWSNLPLSGLFVEMLRRVLDLAPAAGSGAAAVPATAADGAAFTPRRLLSGAGDLVDPAPDTVPIPASEIDKVKASAEHPAGLYTRGAQERALNLSPTAAAMAPVAALPAGVSRASLSPQPARQLAPFAFAAATILFLFDCLAALALGGGLGRLRRRTTAAAVLLALATLPGPGAQAQSADDFALRNALGTHLGYVLTGDATVDQVSAQGLRGLTQVLRDRTAIEPDEPTAVNVERDELVFFPLLYWPVRPDATVPSDAALARVGAYMKNGGTIFFDLRDDGAGSDSLSGNVTAASDALRRILGKLDVPPLEPVPADHVLTRSFYLLQSFPGRYETGTLWVERMDREGAVAGNSDGVSSIIIGANDYAGAWAADEFGNALYAVSSGTDRQRELAFRTGVNVVMYAMTGNYKADQVHVPALLERLGQ